MNIVFDHFAHRQTFAVLLMAAASASLHAQPKPPLPSGTNNSKLATACPDHAKHFIYSTAESGDVVPGPACVGVQINALRYGVEFGLTITYTAGKDVSTALAEPEKSVGDDNLTTDIAKQISQARDQLPNLEHVNQTSSSTVSNALSMLKSLRNKGSPRNGA